MSTVISNYFNSLKCLPKISPEKQLHYIRRAQEGSKSARKKVIVSCLKLVISIGKKYFHSQVSWEDIIAEGNLGLNRALDLFDINSGYAFSTYASYWINQHMYRYIQNFSSIIRVPVYLHDYRNSILKGRKESKKIGQLHRQAENVRRMCSLDLFVGDDDTALSSLIGTTEINSAAIDVKILLSLLDKRERDILQYQLEGYNPREIGLKFGVSRERIRQIAEKAIIKLQKKVSRKRLGISIK